MTNKGKEKVDSCLSCVWDNERLAMERAHEVVTDEDLKVISGVSFNKVMTRHVHKLVQVTCSCNFQSFSFFPYYCTDDFNVLFRC